VAEAKTFELGKSYDFETLAPIILNASYKNVRVLQMMLAEKAITEGDVVTTHEVLKAYISGLPNSINDCSFIQFVTQDGVEFILAKEYINPYSIVQVTKTNLVLTAVSVTSTDIANVLNVVKELGISYTYTTVTE